MWPEIDCFPVRFRYDFLDTGDEFGVLTLDLSPLRKTSANMVGVFF